jgi:hypothetical protein
MRIALGLLFAAAICPAADSVDPSTLQAKVLIGYQGWFNCPTPGAPEQTWSHWSRGVPAPDTLAIDMYPDLREFASSELCAIPGMTIAGKPAYLFSSWSPQIVSSHFRWMKEYGLDGVLVQRFVADIPRRRATGDVVLKNIMAAARESGRCFAIEYDISGADPGRFFDMLREDWTYLVEELKITAHPDYLRHNGKPVVSVWGMGLDEDRHPPRDAATAERVIEWFRSRATYIGGTPSRWRTLAADSIKDPAWSAAYKMMDVVQPWTVGRYRDNASADRWKTDMLAGDLALTAKNGQLYMPVIFPGFSWKNLKGAAGNQIPRNRGEFLWRQAYNAKTAGATMLKIAMFDEVNEGTAIFKIAPRRQDAPDQGYWLTLDADGHDLPADWYLRLAGQITRMFHGALPPAPDMPR